MKTYAICPVSEKRVNEKVARINALLTVLILLAFGLTQNILFVAFLFIDFYIRGLDFARFSPIAYSSNQLAKILTLNINLINAGPKLFAARIGLILSGFIVLSGMLNFYLYANIAAGILGLFSFLEAAFGYCVACKLYPFVYNYIYKS